MPIENAIKRLTSAHTLLEKIKAEKAYPDTQIHICEKAFGKIFTRLDEEMKQRYVSLFSSDQVGLTKGLTELLPIHSPNLANTLIEMITDALINSLNERPLSFHEWQDIVKQLQMLKNHASNSNLIERLSKIIQHVENLIRQLQVQVVQVRERSRDMIIIRTEDSEQEQDRIELENWLKNWGRGNMP